MADFAGLLACPVCGRPLGEADRVLRCSLNHSFDVAREGYVNLLPPAASRERAGDLGEMLRARRRFFEARGFAPLEDALRREAVRVAASSAGEIRVLDAGCGDGRALRLVRTALRDAFPGRAVRAFGFDVAKEAARMSARADSECACFAADTRRRLPVADGAFGILLDLFAPRNMPEFARVLSEGGAMVCVFPKPGHLAGLREAVSLIDVHPEKERLLFAQAEPFFDLEREEDLDFALDLTPALCADLVRMTPSARHLSESDFAALEKRDPPEVRAGLRMLTFRKRA